MASVADLLNPIAYKEVFVAQGAVFLGALVIVKKLYVQPYLQMRDKRTALTEGSQDDAQQYIRDAEGLTTQIDSTVGHAVQDAKKIKDEIRSEALAKKNGIVAAADKEAKQIVDDMSQKVSQQIEQEKGQIPAMVAQLTNELYAQALN